MPTRVDSGLPFATVEQHDPMDSTTRSSGGGASKCAAIMPPAQRCARCQWYVYLDLAFPLRCAGCLLHTLYTLHPASSLPLDICRRPTLPDTTTPS